MGIGAEQQPQEDHAWHGVIQYKRGERKVVKGEAPGAMPGWVTPQEARRRNLKPAAPERRCRHCGRGLEARGIVYGGRVMWVPTEECPCPAAAAEREREERERRAREREDRLHRCGIGRATSTPDRPTPLPGLRRSAT